MSATEVWLVIAAIVAFVSALLQFAGTATVDATALLLSRLGRALMAAAIGLIAVALVVAFP
jgi:hypothetical protein